MNLPRSNITNNSSTNAVLSNNRDVNGPRFQNKNLNSYRGAAPTTTGFRTGRPGENPTPGFSTGPNSQKPAVQVIQAKQKLGKAVGAAALPPTPLNTPSLKRETQTNQTAPWSGQPQSNDEGSPGLKGLSGPAKPAPWAKPGNANEVEKSEEPKPEAPPSKQPTRSWANADESDDEDRQDNPPETEWPDNFRDAVEELPPAAHDNHEGHEGDISQGGNQRYVPPYVRTRPNLIGGGSEDRRPYNNRGYNNDGESFHDNRYGSSSASNRSQGFGYNNRQTEHVDRDVGGRNFNNFRRDHRSQDDREGGHFGREGGYVDSQQRNSRFNNRADDEHEADNRVSSRFNSEQDRSHRYDRYERNEGDSGYRVTRPPVSSTQYESRGNADGRSFRNNDYGGDNNRYGPGNRFSRDNRDLNYADQGQYYNKRPGGSYPARRGPGSEDNDSNYRERSRTMSEDYQQKPGYSTGSRGPGDSARPDDAVDLKDIETSRQEAEYLEQRKTKAPTERQPDRRVENAYSKDESFRQTPHQPHDPYFRQAPEVATTDSRRSGNAPGINRPPYEQGRFESNAGNSHGFDGRPNDNLTYGGNYPSAINGRGNGAVDDGRWGRVNANRGVQNGPFSSNLQRQGYGSAPEKDIIPDYNVARRDAGGYEGNANLTGAYRGQDAVKLSFPQHGSGLHPDERYYQDSYSPPHHPGRVQEPDYGPSRQPTNTWHDEGPSGGIIARGKESQLPYQHPDEGEYEVDISRNFQKIAVNPSGVRDEEFRNRPRQLYDPKSNQLVDTDENLKGRSKTALGLKDGRPTNKDEKQPEGEKWQKILQKSESEEAASKNPAKETLVIERPKNDVHSTNRIETKVEELDKTQKAKLDRQRERASREPRTKGFLYRYNEAGDLERVMCKWEKEQEELERKKGLHTDSEEVFTDRVTVLKKKTDSDENLRVKPSEHMTITAPRASNQSHHGNSSHLTENRGLSTVGNSAVGVEATNGGSNILGTLMQGSSIFDSWNRPNPNTLGDDGRVNWLTGQNNANPNFSPGLSSLGSGLAGIISSSSNVSASLFPNSQQDWSYNTILSNDAGNTSLTPVYTGNSLNEINRPSSFSPFSGMPINLQESGIIQSDKKDGNYTTSSLRSSEDIGAPDSRHFFQREWQRFANSNSFGAVGNKANPKPSRSSIGTNIESPDVEIPNPPPTAAVTTNSTANNNLSTVIASTKSTDNEARGKDTSELQTLPPASARKEEERESNKGGKPGRESTQGIGRSVEQNRKPQQAPYNASNESTKLTNEQGRGGIKPKEPRPVPASTTTTQRTTVTAAAVPTTTSFHTRITTPATTSRASSENRTYRSVEADARVKSDSSERRKEISDSTSKDDDNNRNTAREEFGSTNRRPYSGNNSAGNNNSSSRTSHQYTGSGGRGSRPAYSTSHAPRSGGGGVSRGFSGPRAQSEVLSQSKSNDANDSTLKNTNNNNARN